MLNLQPYSTGKYIQPSFTGKYPHRTDISKKVPVTLYSLEKKITNHVVDDILNATKKFLGKGYSGKAYLTNYKGQPTVIKIIKAKIDEMKEIQKLDLLTKITDKYGKNALKDSQKGIGAFKKGQNGRVHIVSTLVKGNEPIPGKNPLTAQSLKSLIDQITILDKGTHKEGRFLHYDLSNTNIHITDKTAGIFDWEHLGTERLDDLMAKGITHENCNVGDTFYASTNLRNMEVRTLAPYLLQSNTKEAKNVFETYLNLKSDYHKNMSVHYNKMKHESHNDLHVKESKYLNKLHQLSKYEQIHSRLLKGKDGKIPDDIKKAELSKIQLGYYTFITGEYCSDGAYNSKQLGKIYDKSRRFFKDQLKKAEYNLDHDRMIYYKNCINVADVVQPTIIAAKNKKLAEHQTSDLVELIYP